jgi:hypothetical protein
MRKLLQVLDTTVESMEEGRDRDEYWCCAGNLSIMNDKNRALERLAVAA